MNTTEMYARIRALKMMVEIGINSKQFGANASRPQLTAELRHYWLTRLIDVDKLCILRRPGATSLYS